MILLLLLLPVFQTGKVSGETPPSQVTLLQVENLSSGLELLKKGEIDVLWVPTPEKIEEEGIYSLPVAIESWKLLLNPETFDQRERLKINRFLWRSWVASKIEGKVMWSYQPSEDPEYMIKKAVERFRRTFPAPPRGEGKNIRFVFLRNDKEIADLIKINLEAYGYNVKMIPMNVSQFWRHYFSANWDILLAPYSYSKINDVEWVESFTNTYFHRLPPSFKKIFGEDYNRTYVNSVWDLNEYPASITEKHFQEHVFQAMKDSLVVFFAYRYLYVYSSQKYQTNPLLGNDNLLFLIRQGARRIGVINPLSTALSLQKGWFLSPKKDETIEFVFPWQIEYREPCWHLHTLSAKEWRECGIPHGLSWNPVEKRWEIETGEEMDQRYAQWGYGAWSDPIVTRVKIDTSQLKWSHGKPWEIYDALYTLSEERDAGIEGDIVSLWRGLDIRGIFPHGKWVEIEMRHLNSLHPEYMVEKAEETALGEIPWELAYSVKKTAERMNISEYRILYPRNHTEMKKYAEEVEKTLRILVRTGEVPEALKRWPLAPMSPEMGRERYERLLRFIKEHGHYFVSFSPLPIQYVEEGEVMLGQSPSPSKLSSNKTTHLLITHSHPT